MLESFDALDQRRQTRGQIRHIAHLHAGHSDMYAAL